jgi:spore coat protein CotH
MHQPFTARIPLLALLLLLVSALRAAAGDTLTVARPFYHIDQARKLILINQNPADVAPTGATRYLALDKVYRLTQPVHGVKTDSAYQVQDASTERYQLFFTRLPVVHLDTRHTIADTPSVHAEFALVEASGRAVRASLGVEYRGASSQSYPKKSFELSFWADTLGAASRDVTLLGMRNDNKYNLQAMYNEPLRLRSKVANALWQEVHQIYYKALEPEAKNGIAIEYVELFVNGEYRGLYALTERIDRKQLKLKKYNNNDIIGELYKGADWNGATTFSSLPPYDNNLDTWAGFEYKHPEERIDWTNLFNFADFVMNSSNADFYRNYQQKFHLGNAVDYYLFLNLTRATDNTGKNLYIAKYKKNEPYYYVPWDLDGVFGTDWQGLNTGTVNDLLSNGFYQRLNQDCSVGGFRDKLRSRWTELRAGVITEANIMDKFRANYRTLTANNVYAREQLAWGAFQADTTQLAYIQTWLRNRLSYLDGEFSQACVLSAANNRQPAAALRLYPNPTSEYLLVETDAKPYALTIRDLSGRVVLQTTLKGPQTRLDLHGLSKGLYAVSISGPSGAATQKLVVQ